jgi:hypothetical protein
VLHAVEVSSNIRLFVSGKGIYDRKDRYIVLHSWTTGHSPKWGYAKIPGNPGQL